MSVASKLVSAVLPPLPAWVYEVVWEHLDLGVMPYPLAIAQHGEDDTERARLKDQVGDWLERQAEMDGGFGPELNRAMHTIAGFDTELAVVYTDRQRQIRIGCFGHGETGLRVVLQDEVLHLAWVESAYLAASAVEVLPAYGAGDSQSVQIPVAAIPEAMRVWRDTGMLTSAVAVLGRAGADVRQAEKFLRIFATSTGAGQVSALRPSGYLHRKLTAESPVMLLDAPTGRYALSGRAGWLTLAPVDARGMLSRLAGLLSGGFR